MTVQQLDPTCQICRRCANHVLDIDLTSFECFLECSWKRAPEAFVRRHLSGVESGLSLLCFRDRRHVTTGCLEDRSITRSAEKLFGS